MVSSLFGDQPVSNFKGEVSRGISPTQKENATTVWRATLAKVDIDEPTPFDKTLVFSFFCALATLMHTRVVVTWVSSLHFPLSATHSSRGCRRGTGPEQNLGSCSRLLHPMMSMSLMSIMPAEDLTPKNCSAKYCLNQNASMLCHEFRSFTDTRSDGASFLTRPPSHGRHYYPDVIHHLHPAVPRSTAATCALFAATSCVYVVNCTTSP